MSEEVVWGPCGPHPEIVCKVMIGFISLTYNLILHQIDITSRHYAVAFKIPIHNIGIYFDKLYSLRCLFFVISGLVEYGIFQLAGGDRGDKTGMKVRKYVGTMFFAILCLVRVVYLFILYSSSQLSYHVYIILSFEALVYGFHDGSFMALAAKYISIVSMLFNLGRLFVLLVQALLDMIWYSNALLMIKLQCWLTCSFTAAAVIMWYYYNFYITKESGPGEPTQQQMEDIVHKPAEGAIDIFIRRFLPLLYLNKYGDLDKDILPDDMLNKISDRIEHLKSQNKENQESQVQNQIESASDAQTQSGEEVTEVYDNQLSDEERYRNMTHFEILCEKKIGNDGVGAVVSPIMMYWSATVYKDFLYPGTLPYGLLVRDKCHLINMMIPVFNNIGPMTYFVLDNFTDRFICWDWLFDLVWILYIPLPIIFIYAFLAIHTKIPSAKAIVNSRPRIMTMTLVMIITFGYMDPLSYIGVGKYAFRQNPNGFTIQGINNVTALLCRSLFARLSVGYSDVRIKLGYHLPKFRPNHKMSDKNTFWYIFKNTFVRSWEDAKGDFKLDIKKYL